MNTRLKRQYESSPLHGANAPYVEALYEAYLADPAATPEPWRGYFRALSGSGSGGEVSHARLQSEIKRRLATPQRLAGASPPGTAAQASENRLRYRA